MNMPPGGANDSGDQNPIAVPSVKPPKNEEDDEPHPNASSSNDPTIPLPTTTPHSFTPAQPEDEAEFDTPQSSQDTIPHQDVETEEPIITEDDVEHLNSNGFHDTQPYDSEFVQFEGDYFVNLGHKSAAPDFKSYDVTGFRQFCQYLAKNGKKTPKAESLITPQVLQKFAKQIKQAKLEEFRSFLDFTAMKFRDRRKHKIENFVTGRWVLTIKTDKDGQFKKFKTRNGSVEVFRMRRNGIFKRILPQLLAMVSALPRSMPRLVFGIFCILTSKPRFFRGKLTT